MNEVALKDKVVFITGGSRGIGREIALKFAKQGAHIAIAAKTAEPNPKLSGTIYSVADEIMAFGVRALPLQVDIRDENAVYSAFEKCMEYFGQLDILVNNASAITLTPTTQTPIKRFDLMFDVNVRATYLCSQVAIPHLSASANAHILNLSPPLNMKAKWFKNHLAYTMSKYGMSMCTLGMAEELKANKIAVNSLWPKTTIATAAIANNFPSTILEGSRKPEIVADAALEIVTTDSASLTGQFLIDEDFLRTRGFIDFERYAQTPGQKFIADFFLD